MAFHLDMPQSHQDCCELPSVFSVSDGDRAGSGFLSVDISGSDGGVTEVSGLCVSGVVFSVVEVSEVDVSDVDALVGEVLGW